MKAPTPAVVVLSPEFLALAESFGMIPQRLAERVLSRFVRQDPKTVKIAREEGNSGQIDVGALKPGA